MPDHDRPLPECVAEFKHIRESITSLDHKLDRICNAIEGNGQPGLRVRVDRLEQSEERRRWWGRAVSGSIVSLAAVEFWRLFSHK